MTRLLSNLLVATALLSGPASADIVSTGGLTVIAPPPFVNGSFLITLGLPSQVVWAEQKGVTLSAPLFTDTATIPAGTVVDSYFVAFNSRDLTTANAWVQFNVPVLGVIFADAITGFPDANFAP